MKLRRLDGRLLLFQTSRLSPNRSNVNPNIEFGKNCKFPELKNPAGNSGLLINLVVAEFKSLSINTLESSFENVILSTIDVSTNPPGRAPAVAPRASFVSTVAVDRARD